MKIKFLTVMNEGKINKKGIVTLSLVGVALAVLLVVLVMLNGGNGVKSNIQEAVSKENGSSKVNIVHTRGKENANVKIVEYSDLQCPACGMYYPVVKQLIKEFGDKIVFEYRHFPLKSRHKNAEPAALATEAAGLQGKFWEMHDLLFERQKEWSDKSGDGIFKEYAKEIGIDVPLFESDMMFNKDIKMKVENDYQNGISAGVNSTPTFFINGVKVQNPRSYEEFRNTIQQFIVAN